MKISYTTTIHKKINFDPEMFYDEDFQEPSPSFKSHLSTFCYSEESPTFNLNLNSPSGSGSDDNEDHDVKNPVEF